MFEFENSLNPGEDDLATLQTLLTPSLADRVIQWRNPISHPEKRQYPTLFYSTHVPFAGGKINTALTLSLWDIHQYSGDVASYMEWTAFLFNDLNAGLIVR